MNIKKISSFSSITEFADSTLVICDIDDTVLFFPKKEAFITHIMKDLLNAFTPEEVEQEASEFMKMYCQTTHPSHTDLEGFNSLLHRLNSTNGKLVFLTARQKKDEQYTRKHLTQIGIKESDFEVYFTNNQISKGEFIHKKFGAEINSGKWNNVLFIDDREDYILSVWKHFPEIRCYQWVI